MKYRVFILSLLAFAKLNANGQSPSSLLTDGRGWHYRVDVNMGDETATTFTDAFIHGDTIIEGRTCKRLYVESGHDSNYGTQSAWFDTLGRGGKYHSAWYEEGGKVYRIMDGSTEPELVFDFGLHAGDRLPGSDNLFYWYDDHIIVDGSMADDGTRTTPHIYRRMRFAEGEPKESPRLSDWCLIEGVGGNEGILYPESQSAAVQDGFISERFTHCDQFLENKGGIPVYENLIAREDFMTSNTYRPLIEEGKTWIVDNDVAGGNTYHIFAEFSISEGPIAGGVQFWSVSQLQRQNGEIFRESEVVRDYYVGEKDGRLYFWNGSEQQEPVLFMDFSLTAGNSIDIENVKLDEHSVRMEVAAVSDTVLSGYAEHSRRCLHVSYLTEDTPGNWVEVKRDVWIEGIGSLKYGIMFPYYFGTAGAIPSLWECRLGETILYTASDYPDGISSQSLANCHSSQIFDLQGRRLREAPKRGVYVRDGKKVAK